MSEAVLYWMYGAEKSLPLSGWRKFGKRFNTLFEARNAIRETVLNKEALGWAALKIKKYTFTGKGTNMTCVDSTTAWRDVDSIERDGQTIYFD